MAAALAGHTVLAPNNELAALLFDALERAHRAAGRDVWPTPQIRDFGSWQRDQYAQRQLTEGALPRCLTEIEERELWRDVVAASGSGPDSLDPAAAARLARRARRTVIEYGIPWRLLAVQPSEETEVFLQWSRQYDERCRALGCVSSDDLTGRIEAPAERIFWIESPAWRPVAHAWLSRCGICLAPSNVAPTAILRMHADSAGAEMAAAADWAKSGLAVDPNFRAWLCVPDLNSRRADVVDAFDAALAVHRFALGADAGGAPYAVAGGTPLADYACVRIALECLEASTATMSFARFSSLLRTPYLQASDAEQSSAAALDVALRERAPSEASMRFWLDLADATARDVGLAPAAAVQRLRAVGAVLAPARGARRFSDWLVVWTAALQLGPWASQARWSSVEYQAVERLRELLAALASADGFFGVHSRESAVRVLRRAARDTSFQPQTGVPPIWVSSQLADPWLSFSGLWVSNMSADQWPAPVEPVALLPVQLQRSYGVASAKVETQLACALGLQARWLRRASECIFSHADGADGRVTAPSPLLPRDAASLYAAGDAPQPRPHWQAQLRDAAPLERFCDELAPPFTAPERTRGVASLRAQSLCAFRGFAETRLRADGLEQPTPGFNERERGQIVHHALEYVWSVLRDSTALHALSPRAQHDLIDEGASRALHAVCERRDPGPTWRRRERVRLHNLLRLWLDAERQRQPFVVEWLERAAQTVSFAGADFRVRIDRSDRLLQGGRVLIDYKTGSPVPDWRGDRPDNPQLPIYALLSPESLTAVAYGRVNAAESCFVFESERPDIFRPGARATSLEGAANLAALVKIWSTRIEALATDFARGHAAVAPTATACRFCQLQGLCRVPSTLDDEDDS
jgi:ATP-dependent helicase/nuclease subunit B